MPIRATGAPRVMPLFKAAVYSEHCLALHTYLPGPWIRVGRAARCHPCLGRRSTGTTSRLERGCWPDIVCNYDEPEE